VKERGGVIDEQSGASEEEEVVGEGIGESVMGYQNEVDEEIDGLIPETR